MNKAVFLDRDGVICEDTNYITSLKELNIFDYAKKAVETMHEKGYKVIIITNQSAIARGMMKESDLQKINEFIVENIKVDKIYYCPHLPPEEGHNEIKPYNVYCECRKPNNGMIKKAIKEFNIDVGQSYMVGDRKTDIIAGKKSNLTTVFVESGNGNKNEVKSDMFFKNIEEFSKVL